jgi:hypothetical protein
MRELTLNELDMVSGGGETCCCYPPPPTTLGNPGNFKPVGQAGETPSGNSNFITGGTFIPVNNGRAGNSAV